MPLLATALRSARSRVAVVVCAAAACAAGAGCLDTVSLGSGVGEGGGPTQGTRPRLRFPIDDTIEEEVTVGGHGCFPGLDTDLDGDGWTPSLGDCNDCDPDTGPSAVEMPTPAGDPPRDENCDGLVDEADPVCDASLAVDDSDAMAAAHAIDLCAEAGAGRWGVVSAAWVLPDGSQAPTLEGFHRGHGLLGGFGANVAVRHGHRLLALSSGAARQPTDVGYADPRGLDKGFTCEPPDGFPKGSLSCPGVHSGTPRDGVALELLLRAPQNAGALAFDFDFYTFEFPDRACSPFDDLFVTMLSSASGRVEENIAFDSKGNTISVNSVFLDVCACHGGPPCFAGGRGHPCSLGTAQLQGTGFEASADDNHGDRGATGWLTTVAAVERGGTITLRFAIHDAGDGKFDSTVLVDHFRWKRADTQIARTLRESPR